MSLEFENDETLLLNKKKEMETAFNRVNLYQTNYG
jgi:hypothetical protein